MIGLKRPAVPNKNRPGHKYEHEQALRDNAEFDRQALKKFKEDDDIPQTGE